MKTRQRIRHWMAAIAFTQAIAIPGIAGAQSNPDCDPSAADALPLSSESLCAARVAALTERIHSYANDLCTQEEFRLYPQAAQLREDFADLKSECSGALTEAVNTDPLLARYAEALFNSAWDEVPAGLKRARADEAFASALAELVDWAGSADGYDWQRRLAQQQVEHYRRVTGADDDDPRAHLLASLLDRDHLDASLLDRMADDPPPSKSWYGAACGEPRDAAIESALAVLWARHLRARGITDPAPFDSIVEHARERISNPERLDSFLTVAAPEGWAGEYIKDEYFSNDPTREVPVLMQAAVQRLQEATLRRRWRLPQMAPPKVEPGRALAVAGRRFDPQGNLTVVFAGRAQLVGVYPVVGEQRSDELLYDEGWQSADYPHEDFSGILAPGERHGIYDDHSFRHDENGLPLSFLTFQEPLGTPSIYRREYDVVLEVDGQRITHRLRLPPAVSEDEDVAYLHGAQTPDYAQLESDGMLYGLIATGHHTRDIETSGKYLEDMGFELVESETETDVPLQETFFRYLDEADWVAHALSAVESLYDLEPGTLRTPVYQGDRWYQRRMAMYLALERTGGWWRVGTMFGESRETVQRAHDFIAERIESKPALAGYIRRLDEWMDANEPPRKTDMLIKDAHANQYDYAPGMFRINKRGEVRLYRSQTTDGKPFYLRLIGPSPGENDVSYADGEPVSYQRFFEVMAHRPNPFLEWNGSCRSIAKSAFESDQIRKSNVQIIPSEINVGYYAGYYPGFWRYDSHLAVIDGFRRKLTWPQMGRELRHWTLFKTIEDPEETFGRRYETWIVAQSNARGEIVARRGEHRGQVIAREAEDGGLIAIVTDEELEITEGEPITEWTLDGVDREFLLPSEEDYLPRYSEAVRRHRAMNRHLGTHIEVVDVEPTEPNG